MEKSSLQPSSERPVGGAHCDAKRQVAGSAATGTGAAGVGGSAALGTPSSQSGVGARTSGYAAIVSRGSATGGGGAVASHPSGTTPVDSGAPGGNGAAVQHKISIEPEGPTAATAVGRSTAGVPAGGGGAAQTFAPVDGRMPVNPGTMLRIGVEQSQLLLPVPMRLRVVEAMLQPMAAAWCGRRHRVLWAALLVRGQLRITAAHRTREHRAGRQPVRAARPLQRSQETEPVVLTDRMSYTEVAAVAAEFLTWERWA